jgi:hypothetical protein
MLERLNLHVLDILVVDDIRPNQISIEPQRQDALKFVASSRGRGDLCTTFDPFHFNDANFPKEAMDELNKDFARGAIAVKIWKNVGMELKNTAGQYVMPDDPRLAPIYEDISAHHKTLIAHLAEPDTAWGPRHSRAPYAGYYLTNPQWECRRNPVPRQKAPSSGREITCLQ